MDDVYDLIQRLKSKDESFSDFFRRTFSKKVNLSAYAGMWRDFSDKDLAEIEHTISQSRQTKRRYIE